MLVILKIPVVYLCAVVWWAIRAEPAARGGGQAGAARSPALLQLARDYPSGGGLAARGWRASSARDGPRSRGRPPQGGAALSAVPEPRAAIRGRRLRDSSLRPRSSSACSAIAYRPARVIPVAIVVALISARMTERHSKLAGWAVGVGAASFVVGMGIAVLTKNPLY